MPLPIATIYCHHDNVTKPVILKSHAIKVYMERDGMTEEDALEHWSFNMEGTNSSAYCVDDTLTQEEIARECIESQGGEFEPMTDPEERKQIEETARIQGLDLKMLWD